MNSEKTPQMPFKAPFFNLLGAAVLSLLLFLPIEKLQAQEKISNYALVTTLSKDSSDKEFSLELIPLEGNYTNLVKCQITDAQSIHVLSGQKLIVTLNKKWLFYHQKGKAILGTNYDIQNSIKIDELGSSGNSSFAYFPLNWLLKCTPLEYTGFNDNNFYNNYFYQANNISGQVTLSFISQTYPRYYSLLYVIVD